MKILSQPGSLRVLPVFHRKGQIPGHGYLNQTRTFQALIPGHVFVNETVSFVVNDPSGPSLDFSVADNSQYEALI